MPNGSTYGIAIRRTRFTKISRHRYMHTSVGRLPNSMTQRMQQVLA
jgi:hypothetical protein